MATEQLNFKITLSGTYWDKRPEFEILINGNTVVRKTIAEESDVIFVEEFDGEYPDNLDMTLGIRLLNKTDTDTIENETKTAIVKDMLLNIINIEVDGIEMGHLKWTKSQYITSVRPEPILNCTNLGWNGEWQFKFKLPFYIWLLENM
jgi:hypothetical protein